MSERPTLDKQLDGKTFRSFYYLKEELMEFCRTNGLPVSGGKPELTERIAHFLDTGEILSVKKKVQRKTSIGEIRADTQIEPNFVCSEKHREFFKQSISNRFTFNVAFQTWLKNNTGKTYGDAIEAYYRILDEKKNGKTKIDKQFEYNTYIRDFFAENSGRTLEEAIQCWKFKKSLQGHNRYEKSDLSVLYKAAPSMDEREITKKEDLMNLLDLLDQMKISYWIDGGWGVDILLGKQTREHRDIDVDFDHEFTEPLLERLKEHGYEVTTDWSPTRIELKHPQMGYIDIHPFVINADGSAKQVDLEGGWYHFKAEWFTSAIFEGRTIPCISAEAQKLFHSGYELRDVDKFDLENLEKLLT